MDAVIARTTASPRRPAIFSTIDRRFCIGRGSCIGRTRVTA